MARASKGEETRAAILEAALALASSAGLEGVSIGALAERTRMSKSGLFAHFGSKDELEVAILDEAARRFVSVVIAPALREPRGEPRVRALVQRWFAWPRQAFLPGGCIFVAAAAHLDDRPGPSRERLVSIQRDWIDTVTTAARIAVEEGHFRRDLDARQLAYEVYALAFGAHFLARLVREPRADLRVCTAFERILRDARAKESANRSGKSPRVDAGARHVRGHAKEHAKTGGLRGKPNVERK